MNKLILSLFLCAPFALAMKESHENLQISRFYTHLTTPARTLERAQISFETFPGANGQTSVLVNSLSLGVSNWLQVGIVPLFYVAVPEHRWNANFKVNFVREKYFQVGAGYSHFSLNLANLHSVQETNGSMTHQPRADLGFVFTALNYREPSSPYAIGLNLAHLTAGSNSALVERVLRDQIKNKIDWAMDISYDLSALWVVTGGIAESRVNVFELHSPRAFGYGMSVSHRRYSRWFTRFTTGLHYMPSEHRLSALLSFDL